MTILEGFRAFHILAGTTALVSMWFPIFAAKGGALHRKAGVVYFWSMMASSGGALMVAVLRLAGSDPSRASQSIFLGFIALMTGANAIDGRAAVTDKARTMEAGRVRLLPAMVVMISAGALGIWSITIQAWLFVAFAVFGAFNAWSSVRFFLGPPQTPTSWLRHHLVQLGAACIGTITAFLVVNASRVVPERVMWVAWIGPGVLGGVVLSRAIRRFVPRG